MSFGRLADIAHALIRQERNFPKSRTSKRDRKHRASKEPQSWGGLKDAPISNRAKLEQLVQIICRPDHGFGELCGGESGNAKDLIDEMTSITVEQFARSVLLAEGLGRDWEYSEYRSDLEQLFRDVFGDGVVQLESS